MLEDFHARVHVRKKKHEVGLFSSQDKLLTFHTCVLLGQRDNYNKLSLCPFRFLLKTLLQYQSLAEGELLPTPGSSAHTPASFSSSAAGGAVVPTGQSQVSGPSGPDDGFLKKPKKERKERGKENGREEGERGFSCHELVHAVSLKRMYRITETRV